MDPTFQRRSVQDRRSACVASQESTVSGGLGFPRGQLRLGGFPGVHSAWGAGSSQGSACISAPGPSARPGSPLSSESSLADSKHANPDRFQWLERPPENRRRRPVLLRGSQQASRGADRAPCSVAPALRPGSGRCSPSRAAQRPGIWCALHVQLSSIFKAINIPHKFRTRWLCELFDDFLDLSMKRLRKLGCWRSCKQLLKVRFS